MLPDWLPKYDQWEYAFASICLFAVLWIITLLIANRLSRKGENPRDKIDYINALNKFQKEFNQDPLRDLG